MSLDDDRPANVEDGEDASDSRQGEEDGMTEKPGEAEEEAEQTERLLSTENDDLEVGAGRDRHRFRRKQPKLTSILSVVIILSLVVFDAWLMLRPDESRPRSSASTSSIYTGDNTRMSIDELRSRPLRRPDEDYILDPGWDFEAPAQERHYNWTIVDKEGNPDGVYKPMMTINGQYPGPLIEINEGDTIVVDVLNLAKNATAIHWHGIFQNGTNFMDGTAGVTQCPIASGRFFQYKFTVKGQSGTCKYPLYQQRSAPEMKVTFSNAPCRLLSWPSRGSVT